MKQTVLVTGASRGIGAAIAAAFAQEGYRVYANCNHSMMQLQQLVLRLQQEGCDITPVQGDISDGASVRAMFEQMSGIDILINNGGISQIAPFMDLTEEDWDRMIAVNLKSVFLCSKEALGHMIHNKKGKIINISSVWGATGGSCEVHYSAAKAGVIGMTKALAKEMGPSGIQVNCIAPGVIDTSMNGELTAEDISALEEETPLGKIGRPEDVARAALFLARDEFITGEVLHINGGFYI